MESQHSESQEGLHPAHMEDEPRPGLEQLDPLRSWGAVCLNRLERPGQRHQAPHPTWSKAPTAGHISSPLQE